MTAWICATCANQFPDTETPPDVCPICLDERQWVPPSGQRWTDLRRLAQDGHHSDVRRLEPGLIGIGADPPVAIGQRGLLVTTGSGNLLWDPPGFIDTDAIEAVRSAGGLAAISASHPHFYGTIVEWADAFGAQVLLAHDDKDWLMRPTSALRTWSEKLEVLPGVTLVQCGGHFAGSAVVHWAAGADGRGALLAGDSIMVTPGEDRVTFLRSAPNRLPLPASEVQRVVGALAGLDYERIYSGWWSPTIWDNARNIVGRSATRYLQWLSGEALAQGG